MVYLLQVNALKISASYDIIDPNQSFEMGLPGSSIAVKRE
jgi:hypothetical protein